MEKMHESYSDTYNLERGTKEEWDRLFMLNNLLADLFRHTAIRLPEVHPNDWSQEEIDIMEDVIRASDRAFHELWHERDALAKKLEYGVSGCNDNFWLRSRRNVSKRQFIHWRTRGPCSDLR